MKSEVIKEIKFVSGRIVPAGTACEVFPHDKKDDRVVIKFDDGNPGIVHAAIAGRYLSGFEEIDDDDIATAMTDGRCVSITGADVEPDGKDSHGFPSMLRAMGII